MGSILSNIQDSTPPSEDLMTQKLHIKQEKVSAKISLYILFVLLISVIIVILIIFLTKDSSTESKDECAFDSDCRGRSADDGTNDGVCVVTKEGIQKCMDCRNNNDCLTGKVCDISNNKCISAQCSQSNCYYENERCQDLEAPDDHYAYKCVCENLKYVWRREFSGETYDPCT